MPASMAPALLTSTSTWPNTAIASAAFWASTSAGAVVSSSMTFAPASLSEASRSAPFAPRGRAVAITLSPWGGQLWICCLLPFWRTYCVQDGLDKALTEAGRGACDEPGKFGHAGRSRIVLLGASCWPRALGSSDI